MMFTKAKGQKSKLFVRVEVAILANGSILGKDALGFDRRLTKTTRPSTQLKSLGSLKTFIDARLTALLRRS